MTENLPTTTRFRVEPESRGYLQFRVRVPGRAIGAATVSPVETTTDKGSRAARVDNEVSITFVFHAMGDDPVEAMRRCLAYFDPAEPTSVEPMELRIEVTGR
jgi:hypothetical protein